MGVFPTHSDGSFWNSPSSQPRMLYVQPFLLAPGIGISSLNSSPTSPATSWMHSTLPPPVLYTREQGSEVKGLCQEHLHWLSRPSDSLSSLPLPTRAQQSWHWDILHNCILTHRSSPWLVDSRIWGDKQYPSRRFPSPSHHKWDPKWCKRMYGHLGSPTPGDHGH